ncbi:hypothetical protein [Hankyongella ginsenosidimutans]|uniref:hypothetical protein n=1 Tax=Hankyongella ginsenosidimutans TaxID=1763828 RepID=UPI001CA30739|nr:hypothetical protein [Hankyongella ginsenosidimutans]
MIDRHGDVLVVQPNTAGMTAALPDIRAALEALMAPRSIVVASDGPARASEGLEPLSALHGMALPVPLVIEENGCRFAIDPWAGRRPAGSTTTATTAPSPRGSVEAHPS